jgi:hypothetical protein
VLVPLEVLDFSTLIIRKASILSTLALSKLTVKDSQLSLVLKVRGKLNSNGLE